MKNPEQIKKHLKEISTTIFISYNQNNNNAVNTIGNTGTISIIIK